MLRRIRGWRAAGRPVTIARVVGMRGISGQLGTPLAGFAPGEPAAGIVVSGALDAELAVPVEHGHLVELAISDAAAAGAGMSCGGVAIVLVQPVGELPELLWGLLERREPVCVVTAIVGELTGETRVVTRETVAHDASPDVARIFARGTSEGVLVDDLAVTTVWPVPALVVVGDGLIADALVASASLLGWTTTVLHEADDAVAAIGELASSDGVVVLSHSREVDGPALAAALASRAGYIGALGARHTQAARGQWLADHAVTDLSRIHGPAGLDVGARTPAEIALAIVAEMLAERSGRAAVSLRDRPGPVHADGLNAPPPRYPVGSG